jgi:ABC-type branched-subunit amino acid transport system ATPase component
MSSPLVEAQGVVKRYGPTTALADGRLTVLPGESHALVGRNAAPSSSARRRSESTVKVRPASTACGIRNTLPDPR